MGACVSSLYMGALKNVGWGYIRLYRNGKENGNYHIIGLYRVIGGPFFGGPIT